MLRSAEHHALHVGRRLSRHEHPPQGAFAITTNKIKATAVGAGCVAIGVIAGIAGASASPSTHTSTSTNNSGTTTMPHMWGPGAHPRGLRAGPPGMREGGPAVHEQAIVLNKAGTGFITETEDNGTVQSVSGDQLTIKEGVGKVTYKTVTLTIPSGATVIRNFTSAHLSDLKNGDRVHISQSSERTTVLAGNASGPRGGWMHRGRFFRPGGAPGTPGQATPGAVPPGGPGGPGSQAPPTA